MVMIRVSELLEAYYDWGYNSLQLLSGGNDFVYMLLNLLIFVIVQPGLTLLFLIFWLRARAKNKSKLNHD